MYGAWFKPVMAECQQQGKEGKQQRCASGEACIKSKSNKSARERSEQDTRRCNRLAACVMSAHTAMLDSPLAVQHAELFSKRRLLLAWLHNAANQVHALALNM
jgi:hypothetical protein